MLERIKGMLKGWPEGNALAKKALKECGVAKVSELSEFDLDQLEFTLKVGLKGPALAAAGNGATRKTEQPDDGSF
jgi:hypothetical protein